MKKHTVPILLVMLFSASFVAATPFVQAKGKADFNWMKKVDKDLLKKMSNDAESSVLRTIVVAKRRS